jgi:HK97 family phage major capsid protein
MAQLTPEQESFKNEILEQVKGLLKNVASKEDKETLDASIKAFTDRIESASSKQDLESLKADVASIGLIVKKLEEVGKPEAKQDVRSQIAKWQEKNKSILESIKAGNKADLASLGLEFTAKTNSPMTPSNTYNSSAYLPVPEFQAGATEIVRVKPTFWDYIKKGVTSSAAYVWVNKKNPLGAAGFIGPGVAKPGVSFEIATEISNAKKIAVSEKVATELLQDIDGFASWVEQELTYQLKAKLNTTLMTGTASSTVPAGIQTISSAYTLTTVKTTNPNNWDAIRACVAQLRSGNLEGVVTAFLNPVDYANMVLTKAVSQGQIFMPAETGATIVEDNNIPVGYVQVALLDYYKVLIYKDFSMAFGWENDDFTKNLVTVIAEMRIHQFFSENHTGAFIYDTLDNVKTAITEV